MWAIATILLKQGLPVAIHHAVTTDQKTAQLIAHPPKVSHHNDPSSTWYSAPHETVTTNI